MEETEGKIVGEMKGKAEGKIQRGRHRRGRHKSGNIDERRWDGEDMEIRGE